MSKRERNVLAVMVAVALVFAVVWFATADRSAAPPPGGSKVEQGVTPPPVKRAQLMGSGIGDLIQCAAWVGFGGVTVGAVIFGDPPGTVAWIGVGSTVFDGTVLWFNKTCTIDSYKHIGYKPMCWDQTPAYVSPISGRTVFFNENGPCKYSPPTDDAAYCYIISRNGPIRNSADEAACVAVWNGDFLALW